MDEPVALQQAGFGTRLKELREESGYTQTAVGAWFSGVADDKAKKRISAWETGRGQPNATNLRVLTRRLKTTSDYLLFGVNPWPFKTVDQKTFEALAERHKGIVEEAMRQAIARCVGDRFQRPVEAARDVPDTTSPADLYEGPERRRFPPPPARHVPPEGTQ